MVTASIRKHAHRFQIDRDTGTCACGEMQRYSGEGKNATMSVIVKSLEILAGQERAK